MRGIRPYRMPGFGDWPGQNLILEQSLAAAQSAKRQVVKFGPYEAKAELFHTEYEQMKSLQSGAITYRGIDLFSKPYSVNCVHAVTVRLGDFKTGIALRGPTASQAIAEFMNEKGFLVNLNLRRDWDAVLHQQPLILNLQR